MSQSFISSMVSTIVVFSAGNGGMVLKYNPILLYLIHFFAGNATRYAGYSFLTRDQTCASCRGNWSLSHWTVGKFLYLILPLGSYTGSASQFTSASWLSWPVQS